MSYVNPSQSDRVRYQLWNEILGTKTIEDPEGWNEDEKEFTRHKTRFGIFPKFSNSLKFRGEGRKFINSVKEIQGINGKCRLIKSFLDQDQVWRRSYSGWLDMLTREDEEGVISIKFHSGGLEPLMKAKGREKLEIARETTLRGKPVPPLVTDMLRYHGLRVFLDTQFNILPGADSLTIEEQVSGSGDPKEFVGSIPLNLAVDSHEPAQNPIPQTILTDDQVGTTGLMFFANNDRNRILEFPDLSYKIPLHFETYAGIEWMRYTLCLSIYENGISYNLKNRLKLHELTSESPSQAIISEQVLPGDVGGTHPSFTRTMEGSWNGQIELLQGESLALEIYLEYDPSLVHAIKIDAHSMEIDLKMEEDSNFPPSLSEGLLAHDLLSRLAWFITESDGNFVSNYLGRSELPQYDQNGKGAFCFINHGHWIRRFNKDDDLFKPLSTSWNEAFEALSIAYNLGMGIERIGFRERIIVEEQAYFFQNFTTIRLGEEDANGVFQFKQVQKVKRSEDKDWYFVGVEIGSAKGGEYEEVMGLEETNTSANFSTPIEVGNTVYRKEMQFRLDPNGQEILRRRGKETHPNTDQDGDKDKFLNDAKPGIDGIYELNRVADVLQQDPIGFFDAESAYNFIYSPVSLILKHGWMISAGLQKNLQDDLVFGSSRGKSQVSQQLIGENEYAENGNIPIADLDRPRFTPDIIEFEYEVSLDLQREIEGFSIIDGRKVPNVYGLIEFKNENGVIERGYLLQLKPNKEGKWKLLKANR